MAINYNKKIMESVLLSVKTEGNVAQMKAIKSICESSKPLFITGGGGVGKTFFIKRIKSALRNAVFVAPTGIAALNLGGQTIHSFFRIGIKPYIPDIKNGILLPNLDIRIGDDLKKTMESINYLVIDEVSMVRPDLLDNVAAILRETRGRFDPFGGVKLIMIGDLAQLPPVVKEDFFDELYDSRYFFSSKSLMASGMEVINFDKVYRQNDEKFISILNSLRDGEIDDEIIGTLNARCVDPEPEKGYVEIVTTNSKAVEVNDRHLSETPGKMFKFEAEIKGDYPKDAPVEKILFLKIGTRVLITRNGEGYVNGSMGTVFEVKNEWILVKLDNPVKEDGEAYVKVTREEFKKIKYIRNGGKLEETVMGSIVQYPIRLGYSITVHKAQGLTLDSAMMDVTNSFETGQLYTALSRVRSLDGLYLKKEITGHVKLNDPDVNAFYKKVRENNGIIKPIPVKDIEAALIKLSEGEKIDFSAYGI